MEVQDIDATGQPIDPTGQPIDAAGQPVDSMKEKGGDVENFDEIQNTQAVLIGNDGPERTPGLTSNIGQHTREELDAKRDNAAGSDDEVPVSADGLPMDPTVPMDTVENPPRVRRFATIMNLINSVLGAGILGVAGSMNSCGVVIASILILAVAVMTHFGSILTIKLQFRTKANGFDELAEIVLGKIGAICFSVSTVLFCYTCMIAYLVIARDNIVSWFAAGDVNFSSKTAKALVVLINSLVIPIPLTFPRSINFLSYFSFATVVCVVFFFIAMIIKAIIMLPNGVADSVIMSKGGMGLFSAISIYALAFCLPAVLLPIIRPYNQDVAKRGVVTLWAMAMCTILILVPGVLGYLCLGTDAQDNILNSFKPNDVLIIIVKIGFYLVVSFSYPCVGQSVMSSWSQMVFGVNNQADLPTGKRIVVLLLTNIISLLIAMVLPNIRPALSVGGSIGGALDSFVFPPLIWVVLSKRPWTAPRNFFMILYTIFGMAITCICIYQSIVDAIDAFKKNPLF